MSRNSSTIEHSRDEVSLEDILTEFGSAADFSDKSLKYANPKQKKKKKSPAEKPVEEFDKRFNIGGKPENTVSRNKYKLDLSADESYVPPGTDAKTLSHRVKSSGDMFSESLPDSKSIFAKEKKKKGFSFQPKYEAEEEIEHDNEASEAKSFSSKLRGVFKKTDDDFDSEVNAAEEKIEGYFPPSFGEYIVSLFAAVFIKIRGFNRIDVAATMEDEREELGAEVNVRAASKYYGSYIQPARLRLLASLALLAIMVYISLGLPIPGMLKVLRVNAGMCLALQLTIMLLCLDIVTNGIMKLFRIHPGADSLAVVGCILTSLDAVMVISSNAGVPHPPLCAVSSLALVGVMLSSYLTVRSMRKTLRVPAIAKLLYTVVGENNIAGKEITLLKTSRPVTGFVRRSEEAPPDETLFIKLSPVILAVSLLLALIVSAVMGNVTDFIYIFSAILLAGTPVCALLCFALPFFLGTMKLFSYGTAIAGWSGLCDVGQSNNLIVTDSDIFPPGNISIDAIRIFADEDAQKVISYAGSLILASGCGMAKAFSDEMANNGCALFTVENFEPLAGGGLKGQIEGRTVVCGCADLMRLLNVKIPFKLLDKTTVLLAIDGVLFGIFSMKYSPDANIRKALLELMRSSRHPMFAVRDFNITPDMLKELFNIATDGYDFPPYVDRFRITAAKPSEDCQIAAVVCREGLAPLTAMSDTGRSMYMAVKVNLLITAICAFVCMLAVFVKMLISTISMNFILLLLLLSAVPILIISVFMK